MLIVKNIKYHNDEEHQGNEMGNNDYKMNTENNENNNNKITGKEK